MPTRRSFLLFGAALGFLATAAAAQDAAATITAAEYALGMIRGPRRIDAINTLEYWGAGSSNVAGQSFQIAYHASLSYSVPAMRVDITRNSPGGTPQREIQVVSGEFAWNEPTPGAGLTPGSTVTPVPGTVGERLLRLWTTPFGVLKAAVRAGAAARVSVEGGATVITFPLSGAPVKVTLNEKKQVARVETGATEITYTDYKDLGEIASDVLFPARIVQKQGGVPVLELTITKADANNPYVVFPVPEMIEKAPKR